MVKANYLKNNEELLKFVMVGVVFIGIIGFVGAMILNFINQTDHKIYDENNQDLEVYTEKQTQDGFFLSIYNFFVKFKVIMFIMFLGFVFYLIFISKKQSILAFLDDLFK